MAITKCRIWVPPVNRFTAAARVLSQCGRTGATDSPRRFEEKIMSKSNDSSNLDHDTLADSELDAVTGGFKGVAHAIIDSEKNRLEDDQSSVQFSIG
jgi:hypothetical protein